MGVDLEASGEIQVSSPDSASLQINNRAKLFGLTRARIAGSGVLRTRGAVLVIPRCATS